jgi:hypothetical protein
MNGNSKVKTTSHRGIGTKGVHWTDKEKTQWFKRQKIQRPYEKEVIDKIIQLDENYNIEQYGSLSINQKRYPLYAMQTKNWDPKKPTVLITGGVHGYETSGVHGALGFAQTQPQFEEYFNFIIAPCVSPWGYETVNRWNPQAIDPNRSFGGEIVSEESIQLIKYIAKFKQNHILAHFDLHETTDSDAKEFRPALIAKDALPKKEDESIPDGFYSIGDTKKKETRFHQAIIDSVREVTHIAQPDKDELLIGKKPISEGVVLYDVASISACSGLTPARYTSTTEVYPDSPNTCPQKCIDAQIAAIKGGLEYIIRNNLF